MTAKRARGLLLAALAAGFVSGTATAAGWKAGTGRVAITPKSPTWMAGYGSRTHPSEGALHDLWAKALVLEDPSGQRGLIVTLDLCGIGRDVSLSIRDAVQKRHKIPRDRMVLACSHTHTGPVIGDNLITMYPLNDAQKAAVVDYTREFESMVNRAVDEAVGRLEPATLAWGTGRADFAVNRRTNNEPTVPTLRKTNELQGPVDHDVPVLRVTGADDKVKALVFGYACHCTVLSFYQFSGDYAGFAQIALEKAYPEAQAMFVAGCGADQNPLPRRTVELAESYGHQLADAVVKVAATSMTPIKRDLVARYEEIPLRFGTLPTRETIEAEARSTNVPLANRGKLLLGVLDKSGALPKDYPYPVQVWALDDLTWIFLGGEVVVDYSLRLKRNLGSSKTWVSGYSNDVMAYIPSLRVLNEGGYEGATAMVYYGQPTSWSTDVERQIVEAVTRLVEPSRVKN